jgi:drug/metabolite transporter (DMT)-like permease
MFTLPLWSLLTLSAAALQTARNLMQRNLSGTLGLVGATSARFVYGLPFAVLFLAVIAAFGGEPFPAVNARMLVQALLGGIFQIIGTALMLIAMQSRNFAVVTAFTRTDMVQAALFGLVLLGDGLSVSTGIGIVFATVGVVILTAPSFMRDASGQNGSLVASAYGLSAAGSFALAAVFYRGAALSLPDTSFLLAAATVLTVALAAQSITMTGYMLWRDRKALKAIFESWKPSLTAGAFGATASLCWFAAMTLETAARVKTLGLVELLFAMLISGRLLREKLTFLEICGIACIAAGAFLAIV